MTRVVLLAIALALLIAPAATYAQNQTGRLILTVNDMTGGSLPMATVTVTGLDPANRAAKIAPQQTTTSGIVTFEDLAPGRYAVVAEFTGFETSLPREVRVRDGNNNRLGGSYSHQVVASHVGGIGDKPGSRIERVAEDVQIDAVGVYRVIKHRMVELHGNGTIDEAAGADGGPA